MRRRVLNILLLFASLLGYMEWGQGQHAFLVEAEYQLLTGKGGEGAFSHPLVLLPMIGQLLLLFTIFQKEPSKLLTTIAIFLLGILMLFVLLAGLFGQRWLMVLSVLPFILLTVLHFRLPSAKGEG
jgi:hypothetical protein